MLYSTDASVYELVPNKVSVPLSAQDFVNEIRRALNAAETITLRGGGLLLLGRQLVRVPLLIFQNI